MSARFIAAAVLALCAASPAFAEYPERPVTIIVPVAPGTGPDVMARILANQLSQQWKQQVLILNRPGGSGVIGAQAAIQAEPDGYTLYLPLSSAFAILPESKTKLPVDLSADFSTVGLIAELPMLFAVTPKLGVNTLADLIALAKRKPGGILYGATRLSVPHITGEYFNLRAGVQIGYVPTAGAARVVQDIMSGNLQMVIEGLASMSGALQSGAVKALGIASDKRLDSYPDIPLVSETLPGFEAKGWFVLMAPRTTPEGRVRKLSEDLRTALRDPDLKRRFAMAGIFPRPATVEETNAFIKSEQAKWRPIVRQIGTQ